MSKIVKRIIIGVVVLVILVFLYNFVIPQKPVEEPSLISSSQDTTVKQKTEQTNQIAEIGKDFLPILLNVRNLSIDDKIFSEISFSSLRDSSIELLPDGNQGRPNPFAPIGSDIIETVSEVTALDAISLEKETSSQKNVIQDLSESSEEEDLAKQLDELLDLGF